MWWQLPCSMLNPNCNLINDGGSHKIINIGVFRLVETNSGSNIISIRNGEDMAWEREWERHTEDIWYLVGCMVWRAKCFIRHISMRFYVADNFAAVILASVDSSACFYYSPWTPVWVEVSGKCMRMGKNMDFVAVANGFLGNSSLLWRCGLAAPSRIM